MERAKKPHHTQTPSDLSRPMLRVAEALAEGHTREGAARAGGVSPATTYRWLREPAFRDHLRQLTDAVVDRAKRRFQVAADRAAQTIIDLGEGKKPSHPLQLQAAESVLNRSIGRPAGSLNVTTTKSEVLTVLVGYPEGEVPEWARKPPLPDVDAPEVKVLEPGEDGDHGE